MKELLYALPAGMKNAGAQWGLTPAHMVYRVDRGPRLTGAGLTPELQGGAMYIACSQDPGDQDPLPCCRQVLAECRKRGFHRVICDFEGAPVGGMDRLAAALSKACAQNGLALYLPETFAPLSESCRVLVSSALVRGTLERRLNDAAGIYGRDRVVLAVEAGAEDFLLPVSSRRGQPMSQPQLRELMRQLEPAVFFDRGLCAHYFTYMVRGGQAHFILFDTARSVREKLDAAQRLGVSSALLAAPQTEGWLEEIFGQEAP